MAFNEGLSVYASEGKVQPYCLAAEFYVLHMDEAGEFSGPKMDALIRKKYPADIANRLIGKAIHERYDDDPNIWSPSDEPVEISPGFLMFSQEIDLGSDSIIATSIDGDSDFFDLYFWSDAKYMKTSLNRASFDAEFSGLKFVLREIELLLPSAALQLSLAFTPEVNARRPLVGRPPRWDWEGAMVSVIAQAQKPDGLPTGHGAQARIEEMIAAWFTSQTGDCPAISQVRQRAAKIMRMLERPETPESR
jgi:hypothetical protein